MKNKKQKNSSPNPSGSLSHERTNSDFYSGGSESEQPLYSKQHHSSATGVHRTGRHQAVTGGRKETVDPREKQAMIAILKLVCMVLLLLITFFVIWKVVSIYEESVFIKNQSELAAVSPVMNEVLLAEEFDIENQESRDLFAKRIENWKEAERLVRSSDGLLLRNNIDQAIVRCQDALQVNPLHMRALERLGELYFEKGLYSESINAYIRLLSQDPSRVDLQEKVIQVLDANHDADAVTYICQWYLEENPYSANVQRYLANSQFDREEYADAAKAYERVLKDNPGDTEALEKQADAYMYLEQYDPALKTLLKLQGINYRDLNCYRSIAVCHAQLGQGVETVQTLGKAAHLFGQAIVVGWIQDPRLDPIRENRTFQAFADRVGGEEFRKWLEQVAQSMEGKQDENIHPLLMPSKENLPQPDLLKTDDIRSQNE